MITADLHDQSRPLSDQVRSAARLHAHNRGSRADPYVIVVHPSLPARNVKELIALAKARPGQITYGTQRHRRHRAPHHGALSLHGGHQDDARAVQGRRAGAGGSHRGAHPARLRHVSDGLAQAKAGRVRALGGDDARAHSRRARTSRRSPSPACPAIDVTNWHGAHRAEGIAAPGGRAPERRA